MKVGDKVKKSDVLTILRRVLNGMVGLAAANRILCAVEREMETGECND